MAAAVQSQQGSPQLDDGIGQAWRTPEGVYLFGVRHLSPAGAFHLRRFLDEIKPRALLIEGPCDATPMVAELLRDGVVPPVAVLSYTTEAPVQSVVLPLASYSPEYQAMRWAKEHKALCRLIDLPSDVRASLYRLEAAENLIVRQRLDGEEQEEELPEGLRIRADYRRYTEDLYVRAASLDGEEDYETWWERRFEHNLETGAYLRAVARQSSEMRNLTAGREIEAEPLSAAINALRESHMKRVIREVIDSGVEPDTIVAVCGAHHLTGLIDSEPMSDEELKKLPRAETRMTVMPYSYYKLSTFSGYGAGNRAPRYFEMMFEHMQRDDLESLPIAYLSELTRLRREKHGYASTASVIEAARLARSLQYLHDGLLPTLRDLHDAAITAMADGQSASITESFAMVDVGTKIGSLPEGVSQTPIQDDMNRELKRLNLEKYRSVVAQDLALDLRENRRVQSEKLAFLDLERSVFLHRLELLGISFAKKVPLRPDAANWAENWVLCWTPEVEIEVVESVLLGDTIETAAAFMLRERLDRSSDVQQIAELVSSACKCRLPDSITDALRKLQALTSEADGFSPVARAARSLSFLCQYGSVRKFETAPLFPVLRQLFSKAALLLPVCASCNDETARAMADDMSLMHYITQENAGDLDADEPVINDALWLRSLRALAFANDRHPLLCGFSFSLLLERGLIAEEELETEVSRYLSVGNTPEAGAYWFEGLTRRNRYVLLSRQALWKQLDSYVSELDDSEWKRALVCLRRAFGSFEPREKSGICEVLAALWGVDADSAAELLQSMLGDEENRELDAALEELGDFDFDDL